MDNDENQQKLHSTVNDRLSDVEQVAVREFVREFFTVFSKDRRDLIAKLTEMDGNVANPVTPDRRGQQERKKHGEQGGSKQASIAEAYIGPNYASKQLLKQATNAAVKVLDKNWGTISAHFASGKSKEKHHVIEFIALVIKKHYPGFLEKMTEVWRDSAPVESGLRDGFEPGLYQLMRRYKLWTDTDDTQQHGGYFQNSDNHFVVIELLYVNMDRLECLLFNCEGQVHIGSIFISQDSVLSHDAFLNVVLLRRKGASSPDVRQRYLLLRFGKQPQAYHSGISIKLGDRSGRPVSSELLLQRVPPNEQHVDVYRACEEVYKRLSEQSVLIFESVAQDSVVRDYVTSNPPEDLSDAFVPESGPERQLSDEWKDENRVRQVKDIEGLHALTRPLDHTGVVQFAEPSRTLKASRLRNIKIPLFQWSRRTPRKAPS